MRVIAILPAIAAITISSLAYADFRLEMSGKEVREAFGRRAIEDLEVGETSPVGSLTTCSRDGGMFLDTMIGLDENIPGEVSRFTVTRQPDRRVSIEIASEDGSAYAVHQMTIAIVARAHILRCDVSGLDESQLFRVTTINGLTSDREAFE